METIAFNNITPAPDSLKGKVILITGASDGIGRTLAIETARAGATTILLGKSVKKLEAVYDEITEKGYPEPALHPINFINTKEEELYTLVAHVQNMFGKLNALVHNASSYGQLTPIEHLSPTHWQDVMKINMTVPFMLTHAFLPLLRESAPANIIFTLADEAQKGKAYWSAYSASKFALNGFAQSLYEECEASGQIRVNCINPKRVRTPSRVKAYPGLAPESFRTADSIMGAYLHLLGSDLNGTILEL